MKTSQQRIDEIVKQYSDKELEGKILRNMLEALVLQAKLEQIKEFKD